MSMLASYLVTCRKRLRARFIARGASAIALILLALTALFALLFVYFVPGSNWVITARVLLYLVLTVGMVVLVKWPFSVPAVTSEIEHRAPDFEGRLSTWRDANERDDGSPMLALLTGETEAVAKTRQPQQIVGSKEVALPAGLALLLVAALIGSLSTGTTPWHLAGQRLWSGDFFTAAAPRIKVHPGDVVIPRGANVVVEAIATGFAPDDMQMHAAFEQSDGWETAPMSRLGGANGEGKYGFVFVGVSEQVEYYVGARGLNSERHVIHVADLPKVTGVNLTYRYPDWTGLADLEQADGDVAALGGTEVRIRANTDLPVEDPLIVVNGEIIRADSTGFVTAGTFDVAESGSWHVAVRHEGTLARISDSYIIDVVEDSAPEVAFTWPGHDAQATAIEEVTLRFSAQDDFGINSFTFNFSLNGGHWVEMPLATDGGEITLRLEDLRIDNPLAGDADSEDRRLKPGDMITFYAAAEDHTQLARTALYFVDVRPFDRVYRESQSNGGGGQGGGGLEIADRQREILSATWNLINAADKETNVDAAAANDQVEVLALLQRTLKSQVTTLIERASARRLTSDDEIDIFTSELSLATEDMAPAAEQLEANNLSEAIGPEQQALQHLLAALASASDVDVTMGQADGRGTAGRSLSELMDLEMDPERNRYETPQSAGLDDKNEQEEDEWQRLEALAARTEQLAEQQRRGDESLASRWQQERLQRELEELREQLQGRSSGQQSNQQMQNAIAELDAARQAIDQSLQQPEGDPTATREATEAMQRAAEQLRENALGELDERLARTGLRVDNLLSDQRNITDRLNDLQRDVLDAQGDEERRLDDYAMAPYAERKRRMQRDLNEVTREVGSVGDAVDDPATKRVLTQATAELAKEQVDERLAASADAFEYGRPLYAVGNEAGVERALERLSSRLDQARRLLATSDAESSSESSLAQVRTLRQDLTNGADVNGIVRAADALEFQLGHELGEGFEPNTTRSGQAYVPRGAEADNNEVLRQMTQDRLDLIEAALLDIDVAPIRAQEPRDEGRDSAAAARYFRDLSRPEG